MNHQQSQRQNQQQKQGYYMSQQHLKLMHIMHLSGFALQEYIANEIEMNPALEAEPEGENDMEEEETKEKDDYDSELLWLEDDEPYEYDYAHRQTNSNEFHFEAPVVQYNSLQENLK